MFTFLFPSVILNGAPEQCFLHSILQRAVKISEESCQAEMLCFATILPGIHTDSPQLFHNPTGAAMAAGASGDFRFIKAAR